MVSGLFLFNPPHFLELGLWVAVMMGSATVMVWWLWGLLQSTHRMMEEQRTIGALTLFVPFLIFSFQFIAEMLLPMTTSVFGTITDQQGRQLRQMQEKEVWVETPWKVALHWDNSRMVASGDIGFGSAKALKAALDANPKVRLLELDSLGGLVHEENLIIDLVRSQQLDTLVIVKCASACTGVFLAGNQRFISGNARLGFHQSGYEGRSKDTDWQIPEYEASIHFREKKIAQDFAEKALNTSYYEIWKPHPYDVKQSGFATAWWSERPQQYR